MSSGQPHGGLTLLLLSWLLPPVPLEEAPRTFSPNYACPPWGLLALYPLLPELGRPAFHSSQTFPWVAGNVGRGILKQLSPALDLDLEVYRSSAGRAQGPPLALYSG